MIGFTKMNRKLLSIIVACYNESENLNEMYTRIVDVFHKIPSYRYEIIFVDNLSTDNSGEIYRKLTRKDHAVKVILMSRNFGSPQPSFLAGLSHAKGQAAILLHGDIQDPPELIPQFTKAWENGFKVVYGVRKKRNGYNFIWNFFYHAFYYVLKKLSYIDMPLDAGDFSLLDRRVIRELLKIDEYDYYLRCLRAFVGFPQIGIDYVRDARIHGRTSENFLTSIWWAKTIIINFSMKPLELISEFALIIMVFSFLAVIVNVILVLTFGHSPRGIPTIVVLVLFLGGVQLLSLSIIAEYLAKIFLEVKRRPKYIIEKTINI
jgi:polyisoprenyl-phosphate glycosyltransferase